MSTKLPSSDNAGVRPTARAGIGTPYSPPSAGLPIDLFLDANEGPRAGFDPARLAELLNADSARRYPSAAALEESLAKRIGVGSAQVLVTAGGDEAIDRTCRAFLEPGCEVVMPAPTFEMIGRSARLADARVLMIPWHEGPYPIDRVLAVIGELTRMVAVVSPNNPTGAVASARDLARLAAAAPAAVLLVDLAYTEFADVDLTPAALALRNTVVIRTLSKAYGLAGLRVGYAVADEGMVRALRAVGSPYPVSGISVAIAKDALSRDDTELSKVVAQVRTERAGLFQLLRELGALPRASQGNFVLADFDDAERVWLALARSGIAVRRFHGGLGLEQALRITCPANEPSFERLCASLRDALQP